jgi:hypothetical protein
MTASREKQSPPKEKGEGVQAILVKPRGASDEALREAAEKSVRAI